MGQSLVVSHRHFGFIEGTLGRWEGVVGLAEVTCSLFECIGKGVTASLSDECGVDVDIGVVGGFSVSCCNTFLLGLAFIEVIRTYVGNGGSMGAVGRAFTCSPP